MHNDLYLGFSELYQRFHVDTMIKGVVGSGTMLQAEVSRVRVPMR
jgi:hypothetical protein